MKVDKKRTSEKIGIGVCDAFFYPEGSDIPVYLGLTKEGITATYETSWHEITADQLGDTPLDDVAIGEKITVEGKLLDTSLNKISMLFPTGTAIVGSGDEVKAITFGRRPGTRATHHAGKLVLHPVSAGNSKERDLIIHRTTNTGNLSLAYKLDEEWQIPVVFKGYYDDFKPEGDQLFRIGEEGAYSDEYRRIVKFWITPSNPELEVGDTVEFRANAMYEDGTTEDVTTKGKWAVADSEKLTLVLASGVQKGTAIVKGSTVVRAEYAGYSNATTVVIA